MLAVEKRVVARLQVVEDRVAVVVPVAESAREVELFLHLPAVAPVGTVLWAVHLAEKVGRHVLHGIQPETVRAGLVREPPDGAEQQAVHVLGDGIAHVVAAVAMAPRGGPVVHPAGVDAGIREGFARFAGIVLAVGVHVGPIENAVRVGIHERLLVREGIDDGRGAAVDDLDWQIGVEIVFGMVRMADAGPLAVVVALGVSKAGVVIALLRDVLAEGIPVQHLPLVRPSRPAPVFIRRARSPLEVEILRNEAVGLQRAGGAGRHRSAVVGHDVVEIDAKSEPVRHFDELEQLGFRSVLGREGPVLVLAPQIEAVVAIEPDGQPPPRLERRRQPQRRISGFGQFGNPAGQFRPRGVEVLEDHFAGEGAARGKHQQEENARPPLSKTHLHGLHLWVCLNRRLWNAVRSLDVDGPP